jgi:hypothetical protein
MKDQKKPPVRIGVTPATGTCCPLHREPRAIVALEDIVHMRALSPSFQACRDQLERPVSAKRALHFKPLALHLVVRHEEVFVRRR